MLVRNWSMAALLVVLSSLSASAGDWIFDSAPYTNNPQSGARVEQYEKPKEADRVPYDKFFNEEHPYIPYQFYWDEMGWPGAPGTISMPYNGNSTAYPGLMPMGF